jgi:Zn-dependent protease with chaperone function
MAQAEQALQGSVLAIPRWPTERPLRILVVLAALGLWVLLAVTLIGIAYAALIALVFFFAHVGFITHLRGNGVRLGPEQMPELNQRVRELAARLGMRTAPAAYVLQAGGVLNALATRFLGSSFIVLYSDLLEACGDDESARDFIVAHELGHLAAGHLRWRWLLLPGLAVPFLGTAYSRACEYTSDRYGIAVARDRSSALNGLCILAAGAKHGPRVNRRALVAQRRDLATPWMKIGQWLGTHPPIARRLAVLDPSLAEGSWREAGAVTGALGILALLVLVPVGLTIGIGRSVWPKLQQAFQQAQQQQAAQSTPPEPAGASPPGIDPAYYEQIRMEVLALAAIANAHRAQTGAPPADLAALYRLWQETHPGSPDPVDPYAGRPYGYRVEGVEFVIWSSGPDPSDAADDLHYSSAVD